jgi:YNFM family putative membrane transporter
MPSIKVPPILFFFVAAFLMDGLFYNSLLTDAFFADTAFNAQQWHQGILGGASALGYAIGCLVFAPISERFGRRAPTLIATAGLGICMIALPRCESFQTLFICVFAKRLILSMYWPALEAWLADVSKPSNLSRNLGGFNFGWTLGLMSGSFLSGHLGLWVAGESGAYSPAAPYAASLGAAALLFCWIGIFDPGPKMEYVPDESGPILQIKRYFLAKAWVAHLAIYASIGLAIFMLPRLAALPENSVSEAGQSTIHSLRAAISLAAFGAMLASARWHFRFYPIYGGLGLAGAGIAIMAIGSGFSVLLAGSLLLGLASGAIYTVSLYYSLGLPRTKTRGSSIHEALVGVGSAAGPALGGAAALIIASPRTPFAAGLIPIIAAMAAVTLLRRRVKIGNRLRAT